MTMTREEALVAIRGLRQRVKLVAADAATRVPGAVVDDAKVDLALHCYLHGAVTALEALSGHPASELPQLVAESIADIKQAQSALEAP